jgi:plasmid stabilization system protein ParE
MAAIPLEFHPSAIEEAQAARIWYQERSPAVAASFVLELDRALAMVAEAPQRWPHYVHGTRRLLLHTFPFMVVYREKADLIEVIAIGHLHRKPGYWSAR